MSLPRAILLDPNDGALSLARSLARRGVDVVALTSPRSAWIGRSRALRAVAVPPLAEGPEPWIDAIEALADRPGVLISSTDDATCLLVEHRDAIPAVLRSYDADPHLQLMDKERLYAIAGRAGVPVPETRVVARARDVERALNDLRLPCVVKATQGHLAKRSGHGTRAFDDATELERELHAAVEQGLTMLVGELISGPATMLEGVVAVRGADGGYPLLYGRRKLRQLPVDFGVVALMEAYEGDGAVDATRRLLDATGYTGVASAEFKRDARTGELFLIEINVRLPQSFGLGDACGVEASWRLYADLAGLPLEPQRPPIAGRKVWIPQTDVPAVRELRRRGEESVGSALLSLRGVRDFGALSLRDPLPALALVRQEVADRRAARTGSPRGR